MTAAKLTILAALLLGLLTAPAYSADTDALSVREVFASTPGQYDQPVRLHADIAWYGYGFVLRQEGSRGVGGIGGDHIGLEVPSAIARRADVNAFATAIVQAPNRRGALRLTGTMLVRLRYRKCQSGPGQPRRPCLKSVELVKPLNYRELTEEEAGPAP